MMRQRLYDLTTQSHVKRSVDPNSEDLDQWRSGREVVDPERQLDESINAYRRRARNTQNELLYGAEEPGDYAMAAGTGNVAGVGLSHAMRAFVGIVDEFAGQAAKASRASAQLAKRAEAPGAGAIATDVGMQRTAQIRKALDVGNKRSVAYAGPGPATRGRWVQWACPQGSSSYRFHDV